MELIIIVLVIFAAVWFVNQMASRGPNHRVDSTPENNPPKRYHVPKPVKLQPRPPVRQPQRTNFVGCLFALLGFGVICFVIAVAVIFFSMILVDRESVPAEIQVALEEPSYAKLADSTERNNVINTPSGLNPFPTPEPVPESDFTANSRSKYESRIHSFKFEPDGKTTTNTNTHFESDMAVRIISLPLIILAILVTIGLLTAIISIVIARHASRKDLETDDYDSDYDSDSDSMAYQASYRPSAQKTGFLPWILVGSVFAVGFVVILAGLFWVRSSVTIAEAPRDSDMTNAATLVEPPMSQASPEEQIATTKEMSRVFPDLIGVEEPKNGEIDVPIENEEKISDDEIAAIPVDPSIDELDEELDRSGASLLLNTIVRAALKSFEERKSKEKTAIESELGSDTSAAESRPKKKSLNPFQSFTRAMGKELPDGIDENTLMAKVGKFLGKGIAKAEANDVPRPDWVDQPSCPVPNSDHYRTVITIGPYSTRALCDQCTDEEIQNRVDDYACNELGLGPNAQGRVNLPKNWLRNLITRTYQESATVSFGHVVSVHHELVFTSKTRNQIRAQFQEVIVQNRIKWSSISLGCMTLFLLGSFAILKFDPLYRRRIFIVIGTSLVLLLGVGILVLV